MTNSHLPLALLTILCAAYVGATGYQTPVNNWDLIGYVASVHSNAGLSDVAMHQATYDELRRAIPAERFDQITQNSPYSRGVFADPEALDQQLHFYWFRVVYVLLVQAIGHFTQNLAQATYLISAASAAALTLITGMLLHRQAPRLAWPVTAGMLIAILYLGAVPTLARLSTPDALYSIVALAGLSMFYRARTASLVLFAVLPLIRTDAIILCALLGILLLCERDRVWHHYAALALAGVLYFCVNAAYPSYGHLTLLNFTLVPGQRTPYPETLQIVRDPTVYLEVYWQRTVGMLTGKVPWVLLAAATAAILERRRNGYFGPQARIAIIAILYVLLHFLAFPLGVTRHYSFALLISGIYVARALAPLAGISKVRHPARTRTPVKK